jgi:hypothetical protein
VPNTRSDYDLYVCDDDINTTTSRKVAGSIPDKVFEFFSIYLILPLDRLSL